MAKVRLIAIAGMPGSGKGTVTDYLAEKYKFPVVHFGNMFYEEMGRRGLDNVKDENWFRPKLREEQGPAVLAKLVAKKTDELLKNGAKAVVLDGLYSWSEYKYLEEKYGEEIVLIALVAPRKQRYKQALARKDKHRKYVSEVQIREREIGEIENLEKGGPIAFADYYLLNDGLLEDLTQDLEKLLSRIGIGTSFA